MLAGLLAAAAHADTRNPGGEALHRLGAGPAAVAVRGRDKRQELADLRHRRRGAHPGAHPYRLHQRDFGDARGVELSISVNDVAGRADPDRRRHRSRRARRRIAARPADARLQQCADLRVAASPRRLLDGGDLRVWTQVDPASSGLAFPGVAEPHIDVLDDLAAVSPDASGAVTIRVVIPADADAAAVDNALRAVEAVAIRANVQRPKVEIVGEIGERAGLYVLAGQRGYLAAHGLGQFLVRRPGERCRSRARRCPGASWWSPPATGKRRRRRRSTAYCPSVAPRSAPNSGCGAGAHQPVRLPRARRAARAAHDLGVPHGRVQRPPLPRRLRHQAAWRLLSRRLRQADVVADRRLRRRDCCRPRRSWCASTTARPARCR